MADRCPLGKTGTWSSSNRLEEPRTQASFRSREAQWAGPEVIDMCVPTRAPGGAWSLQISGSGAVRPCGSESVLRLLKILDKQSQFLHRAPAASAEAPSGKPPCRRTPYGSWQSAASAVGLEAVGRWLGPGLRQSQGPGLPPAHRRPPAFPGAGPRVLFSQQGLLWGTGQVLPGSEKVSRRCSPSPPPRRGQPGRAGQQPGPSQRTARGAFC